MVTRINDLIHLRLNLIYIWGIAPNIALVKKQNKTKQTESDVKKSMSGGTSHSAYYSENALYSV